MSRRLTHGMAETQPTPPRLSSSIVIVDGNNEILLVQRNPKSQSYAGTHVFPGGNYDLTQDESIQMTGIREVFEETGLLLASPAPGRALPSDNELDEAREAVHAQKRLFRDFLAQSGFTADCEGIPPSLIQSDSPPF
ncbi:uncharacterized protein FIBRA_05769 [Fibroporia radiculosa]|uniref:Nudix hydrolase domain-containing protein n=1 Tax=Fibroporia radiculosa TaxID=599839 RepID=J4GRK3_9APHY|nr:uncharacterized protein FIBRA_05769 [Fibroporia radiculosa]CCM03625.1 predicted protein [Fibroporia radiculosa]